jgi:hypothetical protein
MMQDHLILNAETGWKTNLSGEELRKQMKGIADGKTADLPV